MTVRNGIKCLVKDIIYTDNCISSVQLSLQRVNSIQGMTKFFFFQLTHIVLSYSRLSAELLEELMMDVSRELEAINEDIINHVYSAEFKEIPVEDDGSNATSLAAD